MTDPDVLDGIEAALDCDRSFAGVRARAGAAAAAAEAAPSDAETVTGVAALLDDELDAAAATIERVTGLGTLAADVQSACVDALAESADAGRDGVAAAFPPLARASRRGRTADVRAGAAERCRVVLNEADDVPAGAIPVGTLTEAFAAGERGVREQLAGTDGVAVGDAGVYANVATHAPARASTVVRWLLRFDDFERVESRLAFEHAVAAVLATVNDEIADRVLDVVLDHLGDEARGRRRTAAAALATDPDAIPAGRVDETVAALRDRFDDAAGIRRDATATVVALLDRVRSPVDGAFDQLRADGVSTRGVLRGLDELDASVDAAASTGAVDFLLDDCDGAATGWTARTLGEFLAAGGVHRWPEVGAALVAGAADADDSSDGMDAAAELAALAPGVSGDDDVAERVRAFATVAGEVRLGPTRAFVALVRPPEAVEVDVDRAAARRHAFTACLKTSRATDRARRRRGLLAIELLAAGAADAARDDADDVERIAPSVANALRSTPGAHGATAESVAARTRLVAALPDDHPSVHASSTVAGVLGQDDPDVRQSGVDLLAAVVDQRTERFEDGVGARFVCCLCDDREAVRRRALAATPTVLPGLDGSAAVAVVDSLLAMVGEETGRTRRRAFEALTAVAPDLPDGCVDRVASVALLALSSSDRGRRSLAADLLVAVAPRVDAARAPVVAEGVVGASRAHADVVFDGLDVLWALAATPGTGECVAGGFARTLAASRVARDHLRTDDVEFEVTTAQVRRVTDGLVDRIACCEGDSDGNAAATALDAVATSLPADGVEPVVAVLADAVASGDAAVRASAVDALASVAAAVGDAAPRATWTPLGALLADDRERVRQGGVAVLRAVAAADGDPTAVADADANASADALRRTVEGLLVDSAAPVRGAATEAVPALATATGTNGAFGAAWAVERLLERTEDDARRVRREAVEGIRAVVADTDGARSHAPVGARLAEVASTDDADTVRETAVDALLAVGGDDPRRSVERASSVLSDPAAGVRETAVESVAGFVERTEPSSGVRSRVVVRLGERVRDDASASVRVAAARAASSIVAAVVAERGEREPGRRESTGEWPPMEWIRHALRDDEASVRHVIVDAIPSVAGAVIPDAAEVLVRALVGARSDADDWPTDADVAAATALAERVDVAADRDVERSLLAALPEASGARVGAVLTALAEVTARAGEAADAVAEALLDRVATAPRPTGPMGKSRPAHEAATARALLEELVAAFPASFGTGVDPALLPVSLGADHDRDHVRDHVRGDHVREDHVRAAAARVLAAVFEHGSNPERAVRTRDDLQACLALPDVDDPTRLALLSLLAAEPLLARSQRPADGT